jgi:hypothetical protein
MKCKKCGHRTSDINAMRKHYMKAHPAAMKHTGPRKSRKSGSYSGVIPSGMAFCPHCGGKL